MTKFEGLTDEENELVHRWIDNGLEKKRLSRELVSSGIEVVVEYLDHLSMGQHDLTLITQLAVTKRCKVLRAETEEG